MSHPCQRWLEKHDWLQISKQEVGKKLIKLELWCWAVSLEICQQAAKNPDLYSQCPLKAIGRGCLEANANL